MEDSQIVALYLARDENAIRQSAEKYGARLRALAACIVGERTEAEECENDTYLRAWQTIPPHEPRDYLFAYLAKIIRNLSLDRCRAAGSQKRGARLVELSEELEASLCAPERASDALDAAELSRLVSAWLRASPPERRSIFLRRYWYMDSVAELARRFSSSESRVKTILFRARRDLKRHLEKEGYVL